MIKKKKEKINTFVLMTTFATLHNNIIEIPELS